MELSTPESTHRWNGGRWKSAPPVRCGIKRLSTCVLSQLLQAPIFKCAVVPGKQCSLLSSTTSPLATLLWRTLSLAGEGCDMWVSFGAGHSIVLLSAILFHLALFYSFLWVYIKISLNLFFYIINLGYIYKTIIELYLIYL